MASKVSGNSGNLSQKHHEQTPRCDLQCQKKAYGRLVDAVVDLTAKGVKTTVEHAIFGVSVIVSEKHLPTLVGVKIGTDMTVDLKADSTKTYIRDRFDLGKH